MAAQLTVGVGADIKPLEKGLSEATSDIKAFDQSIAKTAKTSEQALQKFGKTAVTETKKVGVAFQGTARVLQDAAFGPGAIANNLAGLGDDFRQLSQQAKDSGQSIGKTLIQSLAGGGGLNIALGGVTLALSLASFGMQAWTRAFGDANKETKKGTDDIQDYVKTLGSVDQATANAAINSQKELTTVRLLFNVYQNANLPLKARKEAYVSLQEQYPAYFGNLKFEKEATDRTKDAYDSLTSSILASARSRSALDLIAKKSGEIQILEIERGKLQEQQENRQRRINFLNDNWKNLNIDAVQVLDEIRKLTFERNVFYNKEIDVNKQIAVLKGDQLKLEKNVNSEIAKGGSLIDNNAHKVEETIKNRIPNLAASIGMLDQAFSDSITKNIQNIPHLFKDVILLVNGQIASLGIPDLVAPALDFTNIDKINTKSSAILLGYKSIVDESIQLNQFLSDSFTSTFGSIGESLGNALASGTNVIGAFGETLLSSIGDILVQFGKLTIAAGVAALGLSAALSNPLNPASGLAAIGAGIALVAIGSAVKSFSKGIGGGGGSGAPSSAPTSGRFHTTGPSSGFAGSGTMQLIPTTTIKGQDIVTSYNRTTSLNSRQGV